MRPSVRLLFRASVPPWGAEAVPDWHPDDALRSRVASATAFMKGAISKLLPGEWRKCAILRPVVQGSDIDDKQMSVSAVASTRNQRALLVRTGRL